MALLRHLQGSITRVLPHAQNRRHIIPRRGVPTTVTTTILVESSTTTGVEFSDVFWSGGSTPIDGHSVANTARAEMRFENIQVPAGANVRRATLQFNVLSITGAGAPLTDVTAQFLPNPPVISSTNRPSQWFLTQGARHDISTTGLFNIDITVPVAVAIGQTGWVSGNAINLQLFDLLTGPSDNFALFDQPSVVPYVLAISF